MPSVRDYYCPPDVYDLIYGDITADVAFWVEQARAAGPGPVLEVACGNGRVLVPCVEAGVAIDGLDITEAMVEALRAKLAAKELRADVAVADMRDFARPRRYALIFIAFNSFLHNLTQEDQLATLRRCREHLAPGGRLMMNIFHPSQRILIEHDGVPRLFKERALPGADPAAPGARGAGPGTARVTDIRTGDPVAQINHTRRRLEILDAAGRVTATHAFEFDVRYIYKPEMELLLAAAGFQRVAVEAHTAFTQGFAAKPAIEGGDTLVWTAWKE